MATQNTVTLHVYIVSSTTLLHVCKYVKVTEVEHATSSMSVLGAQNKVVGFLQIT